MRTVVRDGSTKDAQANRQPIIDISSGMLMCVSNVSIAPEPFRLDAIIAVLPLLII